jgi:hypothetical protein
MPIATIRRRVGKLETEGPFRRIRHYPPLTAQEIDTIVHRLEEDDRLTIEEVEPMEQHSPIICGEFLITAYGRRVIVKRYGGLNLEEL